MQSAFNQPQGAIQSSSKPFVDEQYDLGGLDMAMPDQVSAENSSPYLTNVRRYAREDGETRVAARTRKGSSRITAPAGQTLDAQNVATATGDLEFTTTRIIAQPFDATADGALTRVAPEIKADSTSRGHVIVDICLDNGGVPGQVVASSSILSSAITTTYQYLDSYLVDAPTVETGEQYWLLLYIQDNGSGSYYVRQTADAGALDLESTDEGSSWASLNASFRFKSYVSVDEGVKGFHRRYPSDGANRTLFAAGTELYSAQDNGTVASIYSSIDAGADKVRFAEVDDKTMFVDGVGVPKWWDGTTVSTITNAPSAASLVKIHQGRAFFLTEKALWRFSDLYDFTSYPSVNFFYVPSPKSPDGVTGARTFQDNFVVFTHETKHIIYGNDISTFTRKEAIGTKGAVSDEAIAVDRNYCYFMADDKNIYAWAGGDDILLSDRIIPELNSIQDVSKVRLHLYNNQLRVYYPSTGSAYNDRMLLLDLTYSNFQKRDFQWFMDTGRPVAGSLEWNQDNNELIEFSSRTPWMLRGEQNYSDVGKAIAFRYWTKYKNYGSSASKKRIKRFRPFLRTVTSDYSLLIGRDLDFQNDPDMREYLVSGGGAKWGAFVWNDGTKFGKRKYIDKKSAMSGRGNQIQYRFEREGVETPVEIYGYFCLLKVGVRK